MVERLRFGKAKGDGTMPETAGVDVTLTADATQAQYELRKAAILVYPQFTLMRIGWEIEPGRVQGGIYYRLGDGLGPVPRDSTVRDELRRAVQLHVDRPWGIEVLAEPTK